MFVVCGAAVRFFVCILLSASAFLFPQHVYASGFNNLSDQLSRIKALTPADHVIQFTSVLGVSSGTIQLSFGNAVSDTNDVDYTDVDFLYGPIGFEVQQGLYMVPGTNTWGVTLDATQKRLTLRYPTSNATPIYPGDRVILIIGKGALHGAPTVKTQWRQFINGSASNTGYEIIITTGTARGSVVVPIVSKDSASIICQNELSAPSDLGVTVGGGGSLAIIWKDNAHNEDGFFIERSELRQVAVGDTITETPTSFSQVINVRGADTVTASDTSITLGGKYQYRVRAYNTCGFSPYSSTAVIQTNPGTVAIAVPSVQIKPVVQPPTPARVTESPSQIEIAPPKTPVTETPRSVEKALEPIKPPEPPKSPAPSPTPTPTETKTPSPVEQRPTPPAQPSNVSGVSVSATFDSVRFSWTLPPQRDIQAIQVQRSESAFPKSIADGQTVFRGLATTFNDSRLSSRTVYYYTFFTISSDGISSSGTFLVATVRELPPPPPSVPPPTPSTVSAQEASRQIEKPPLASVQVAVPLTPSLAPISPLPAGALAPSPVVGVAQTPIVISEPVKPAVTIILPKEDVVKEIKPDESQRAAVVMEDSKGGSTAFTVDIPKDAISEQAEVVIAPLTTTQANIIDRNLAVPLGHEALGNAVYKIQVKKATGERITKFDKPLRITLSYDPNLAQGLDEESLKVYYWESTKAIWIPLPSYVDKESKTIIAEAPHTTLFSILGKQRTDLTSAEKKDVTVASVSQAIIRRPESYIITPYDVGMTLDKDGDGTWSLVRTRESTFYVTPFSLMHVCIPIALLSATDSVTLSISNALGSDDYYLTKDEERQCYAATITTPPTLGEYGLMFKTVDRDEFVRTNRFTLVVAYPHEILIVPFIENLTQSMGTPRIAFLSLLLLLVVAGFIFYDVYRKVLKRKFQKS